MDAFKTWYDLLNQTEKKQLLKLSFFAWLVSVVELGAAFSTMIFVTHALHGSGTLFTFEILKTYSHRIILIAFGLSLLAVLIMRALLSRAYAAWLSSFCFGVQQRLSSAALKHYLALDYHVFVQTHSADAQYLIFTSTSMHAQLGVALLTAFSELLTMLMMYAALLYQSWLTVIFLTVIALTAALPALKVLSDKTKQAGVDASAALVSGHKLFTQLFGNFKLIKIQSVGDFFSTRYHAYAQAYAHAQSRYALYQQLPRITFESAAYIGIVLVILCVLIGGGALMHHMAFISFLGLCVLRFMPSITRLVAAKNQMIFSAQPIARLRYFFAQDVLSTIEMHSPAYVHDIVFDNVTFGYKADKNVLQNFSATIKQSSRCAIIGQSGSGKSTLIDLLLGLHSVRQGAICIDGTVMTQEELRSFARTVGYVPQTTYLFDGSIKDNILFGRALDLKALKDACDKAHVTTFAPQLSDLERQVGEGGALLSGGQRQRIALARALYASPQLLILDEATSALDPIIEQEILSELMQLDRAVTLLFITHKHQLLGFFDQVIDLDSVNKTNNTAVKDSRRVHP